MFLSCPDPGLHSPPLLALHGRHLLLADRSSRNWGRHGWRGQGGGQEGEGGGGEGARARQLRQEQQSRRSCCSCRRCRSTARQQQPAGRPAAFGPGSGGLPGLSLGRSWRRSREAGQPGQPDDQAGLQVSEPAWLPAELSGRPSAAGIPPEQAAPVPPARELPGNVQPAWAGLLSLVNQDLKQFLWR